jgi:PEP-CTERM motif
MRNPLSASVLALVVGFTSTRATAELITFDELDASSGDIPLGSVPLYQDLEWSDVSAYTTVPGFPGFSNGIVSGPTAAYGGGETFGTGLVPIVSSISSTSLFDFESVWLGAGYYDDLVVTFTGLYAGTTLFTRSVTVDTLGADFFSFDFVGIDTLLIQGALGATTTDPYGCGAFNCTQFTIDSLSITPGVPEPSSFVLLLTGIAAAWVFRRRTGKQDAPAVP